MPTKTKVTTKKASKSKSKASKSESKVFGVKIGGIKSEVKASTKSNTTKGKKMPKLKVIPPASIKKPKNVAFNTESFSIQKTTDYDQFKIIKGNRDINHSKKIKDAILENNLLAVNPIIVNERMEIIDGQGRTGAVKMIKDEYDISLELYYRIIPGLRLKDVQNMNSSSTNWNAKNYAKSYADRGNVNYLTFLSFKKEYPSIKDVSARMILSNSSQYGNTPCNITTFEKGKFKVVNNEAKAKNIADTIIAFTPFFDNSAGTYRIFVGVIMDLLKDNIFVANQNEIIRKLGVDENKGKLYGQMNSISPLKYKSILNSVLNHRAKNRVYFKNMTQEIINGFLS